MVLSCSDVGLIRCDKESSVFCVVSICVLSADNITFAVDDLCTSQRLRPVRHVAAEQLMLLTVVALILIVHGGPKT